MENATKAIIIAASIAITLAIVTIGFFVLGTGKDIANDGMSDLTNMANSVADDQYTRYDNMDVSGSQVINLIRSVENSGDYIGVNVVTGKGSDVWYVYEAKDIDNLSSASGNLDDALDVEDVAYINKTAMFRGKVERDSNGRIARITFKQK
ncbi:MAG TPA: hypothetical protein PK604_14505 [Acetivibrio clariflavus]|nr:hypothetical protein [Acetivibrio clariflavus]